MKRSFWLILAVLILNTVLGSSLAFAQFDHQLVRRLVVFPLKADKALESTADEAWWQAREEFTKSRRFLVASKQFMIKSDVFQARGDLEPADAILLGRLLDGHALVTMQLDSRRLLMTVYDGGNGVTLYRKPYPLHPSLVISDQLGALTRRAVNEFIASIPYQGFSTIDALIGSTVFTKGDTKLVKIDLGSASGAQIGDAVQWLKIASFGDEPLFMGGAKITVFAEGRIVKLDEGIATTEILRANNLQDIREHALVRVPREAERLKSSFVTADKVRATLTSELLAPEISPMKELAKERKPLIATLSFVGSLAAYLLLAF